MEFTKEEDIQTVADELWTTFLTLNSRIDEELTNADASSCLSVSSTDITPTTTVINTSKLKLSLPTFSGNILQWWDFWSLFSDIIDKEKSLMDSEKICHLLSSMKGSDVQDLAQCVAAHSRGYADLVKALQDCYGQQHTVYQHHVHELLAKRKYDYNQADLQELVDHFKAHQSGFSRNNGSTLDQVMVAIYEEFLGEETLKEWHIYSAKTKEPASAEQFLQFIEERVNAFPMVHAKKPIIKPCAHRASDAKAFVMQAKSSSVELSCPACDGAPHSLFQCSTFKSWDQERRHRLVKRIKLCYNCLGMGLLLQNCPSHCSCKTCNRRHHYLLHRTDSSPTSSNSAGVRTANKALALCSSSEVTPMATVLNTAVVSVVSGFRCFQVAPRLSPGQFWIQEQPCIW